MDAVRLHEAGKLYAACREYGLDAILATKLEALAWASCVEHGSLHGIPVWRYVSGAYEQTLFATNRQETHMRAFTAAYASQIQKAISMLAVPLIRRKLQTRPHWFVEASETELESMCSYGPWKDAYLNDIRSSKAVLQERDEDSGQFIECRRCKSQSVDTEQKQTRSADEPMTLFCMCRKCGLRFTMH